jgi:ferredoxin
MDARQLDAMIQALRHAGRTVIGPVVRDSVVSLDELDGITALPRGWAEYQDAGTYRLEPTGTAELFGTSTPSLPWKRYLQPERTLLISAVRRDGTVTVHTPVADPPPYAFFGMRGCDLASLDMLDRVFADAENADPWYRAVRDDLFVVAAACARPGRTCFCHSMGTGPSPSGGYDLAISEVPIAEPTAGVEGGAELEYLVEIGSDRGRALVSEMAASVAEPALVDAAATQHERAAASMVRELDAADPPLAAEDPVATRWADVAERCLACGNCTMVCPTCFCSTTEDVTDLARTSTDRYRVWDSCFTLDFSYLHGGSVRATVESRYRHWLLHKLVTWHDQFGTSGCVGCGRCITWCPVGIDLTVEIAALADSRRAAHAAGGLPAGDAP